MTACDPSVATRVSLPTPAFRCDQRTLRISNKDPQPERLKVRPSPAGIFAAIPEKWQNH